MALTEKVLVRADARTFSTKVMRPVYLFRVEECSRSGVLALHRISLSVFEQSAESSPLTIRSPTIRITISTSLSRGALGMPSRSNDRYDFPVHSKSIVSPSALTGAKRNSTTRNDDRCFMGSGLRNGRTKIFRIFRPTRSTFSFFIRRVGPPTCISTIRAVGLYPPSQSNRHRSVCLIAYAEPHQRRAHMHGVGLVDLHACMRCKRCCGHHRTRWPVWFDGCFDGRNKKSA